MHSLLKAPAFNINHDLTLIRKKKPEGKVLFSTPYTMHTLDYDTYDVVERLKELTIQNYSETLVDINDDKPPLLFVFGKVIHGKKIYIKLKIKDTKKVLCVSFHYPEYEMIHPYI